MGTTHQSLRVLGKSILSRLENNKYIIFNPTKRNELQDSLYSELVKWIITDEDIVTQVRDQVASRTEQLNDYSITETEAFKSRRAAIRKEVNDNELHGFYFKGTLRDVCINVGKFLFKTPIVEDVFESDENIHKLVMDTIRKFDEGKIQ